MIEWTKHALKRLEVRGLAKHKVKVQRIAALAAALGRERLCCGGITVVMDGKKVVTVWRRNEH